MNIQDTLNNLKAISDEVAELQRKAKEARKAALEPFLDELAKSGTVSIITIRGYTPSFNDGEPCEHSASFWVNIKQHAKDEIDQNGELEDVFGALQGSSWRPTEKDKAANRAICAEHGHVYDEPSKEIIDAIAAVIFDSIEEDYSTNYYVTFTLKDGKFVREEGDYDCDY